MRIYIVKEEAVDEWAGPIQSSKIDITDHLPMIARLYAIATEDKNNGQKALLMSEMVNDIVKLIQK